MNKLISKSVSFILIANILLSSILPNLVFARVLDNAGDNPPPPAGPAPESPAAADQPAVNTSTLLNEELMNQAAGSADTTPDVNAGAARMWEEMNQGTQPAQTAPAQVSQENTNVDRGDVGIPAGSVIIPATQPESTPKQPSINYSESSYYSQGSYYSESSYYTPSQSVQTPSGLHDLPPVNSVNPIPQPAASCPWRGPWGCTGNCQCGGSYMDKACSDEVTPCTCNACPEATQPPPSTGLHDIPAQSQPSAPSSPVTCTEGVTNCVWSNATNSCGSQTCYRYLTAALSADCQQVSFTNNTSACPTTSTVNTIEAERGQEIAYEEQHPNPTPEATTYYKGYGRNAPIITNPQTQQAAIDSYDNGGVSSQIDIDRVNATQRASQSGDSNGIPYQVAKLPGDVKDNVDGWLKGVNWGQNNAQVTDDLAKIQADKDKKNNDDIDKWAPSPPDLSAAQSAGAANGFQVFGDSSSFSVSLMSFSPFQIRRPALFPQGSPIPAGEGVIKDPITTPLPSIPPTPSPSPDNHVIKDPITTPLPSIPPTPSPSPDNHVIKDPIPSPIPGLDDGPGGRVNKAADQAAAQALELAGGSYFSQGSTSTGADRDQENIIAEGIAQRYTTSDLSESIKNGQTRDEKVDTAVRLTSLIVEDPHIADVVGRYITDRNTTDLQQIILAGGNRSVDLLTRVKEVAGSDPVTQKDVDKIERKLSDQGLGLYKDDAASYNINPTTGNRRLDDWIKERKASPEMSLSSKDISNNLEGVQQTASTILAGIKDNLEPILDDELKKIAQDSGLNS